MQNLGKGFLSLNTTTNGFAIYGQHCVRSAMSYPFRDGRLTAVDVAKDKPRVYVQGDFADELATAVDGHLYKYGDLSFVRRGPLVIDRVMKIDMREDSRYFVTFLDFDDILTFDTEEPREMLERAQKFVETGRFPDSFPL